MLIGVLLSAAEASSDGASSNSATGNGAQVRVIVKLEDVALATYRGELRGLAPTSPRMTGFTRLNVRSSASAAYLAYLDTKLLTFESAASRALPAARITHRFRIVFGGVAMLVPKDQIAAVEALPGVRAVYPDVSRQLATDRSPHFIQADKVWSRLGGKKNAGTGVIIGILDTGIWPEHPSFADPDPSGTQYPPPPSHWNGGGGPVCDPPTDGSVPLVCNNKLIGARRGSFPTARDPIGHGTHVASTAAGNAGVGAAIDGVSRGTLSGIAPRAHVAAYRVCDDGCADSDLIAGIDHAVADGVDVLNLSVTGGYRPYTDPVEMALLDAYAAGVFVASIAGNDGPAPRTTSHRGGWVTTVGASTGSRLFVGKVLLRADDSKRLVLSGGSVTRGLATSAPVVLASGSGDDFCDRRFPVGVFNGAIVACQRGGDSTRVEKGVNVLAGGAGGMILYNPTDDPTLQDIAADNHVLPAVHVDATTGSALVAFLTAHAGVSGKIRGGKAAKTKGDVIASFSSRGGRPHFAQPRLGLGISKPDLIAPGVEILAGNTPGQDSELFRLANGSSMSSPHVAGVAALLKALHPGWTPGQIKSALMTTARIKVFKEDGTIPADPFDAGSGRVDALKAANPGLTFDVPPADFLTHAHELWATNYPSVFLPYATSTFTVTRRPHSELKKDATWKLSVHGPPDLSVTIPDTLFIPAGGDGAFQISVDVTAVPPGQIRHARVDLKHGASTVHVPISVIRWEGGCTAPPLSVADPSTTTGDTTGRGDHTTGTCQLGGADDVAYEVVAANTGTLHVALDPDKTVTGLGLYVRTACSDPITELGCTFPGDQSLDVPVKAGDRMLVFVDGINASRHGPYSLMITSHP